MKREDRKIMVKSSEISYDSLRDLSIYLINNLSKIRECDKDDKGSYLS